jgi:hypothetical protein
VVWPPDGRRIDRPADPHRQHAYPPPGQHSVWIYPLFRWVGKFSTQPLRQAMALLPRCLARVRRWRLGTQCVQGTPAGRRYVPNGAEQAP